MIKQAYFRGLMKVAAAPADPTEWPAWQKQQQQKDRMLINGNHKIPGAELKDHGFYRGTPIIDYVGRNNSSFLYPADLRQDQARQSAGKFADGWMDPVHRKLLDYYYDIGRQNRDFYLKQGFRPPKDHKYKTQFPFPNHPRKKQMMEQNQHQVRNTRGAQDYSGHA